MASLRKMARKAPIAASKEDISVDGVIELSVTVGYPSADVQKGELALLERLLVEHCEAGLVSLERGDIEQHLHFQMVCRARVTSARAFGILVRKYMNWFGRKNMVPAGKVMCKVLINRLIHTWKGMLGYCLKDSGATHFECAMHNITDDEVIAGKTLHSIYGKADLKCRVCLTTKNVGERAYVWYKYRETRQLTTSFLSTLTDMVKSAMFIPAAQWIIPFNGQGMDQRKMNSYWKCLTDPCNVVKSDIAEIFVNTKEGFKLRYYPEEDDLVIPKEEKNAYSTSPPSSSVDTEPGLRKLPRTLAVETEASVRDRCNTSALQVEGHEVSAAGTKRKFHVESREGDCRPLKIGGAKLAADFVPLKDRATLPTNTCLPTVDVLAGSSKTTTGLRDEAFWEWLREIKSASKVISSQVKYDAGKPSTSNSAEDPSSRAGVEEPVEGERVASSGVLLHEGIELIILSDSEDEVDLPAMRYVVKQEKIDSDPTLSGCDTGDAGGGCDARGADGADERCIGADLEETVAGEGKAVCAALLHEGIELVNLFDSEDEDEGPCVQYAVKPALVFEDRKASNSDPNVVVPIYFATNDVIQSMGSAKRYRYKEDSRN